MNNYTRAEHHIRSMDLDESTKESILRNLRAWLEDDEFAEYSAQVNDLIERGQWELISDSFYQMLPFGTGGRRGPVGIGPNRFNPYTLTSSIQGHVEYLRQQQEKKGWDELAVVVAYDARCFLDVAGKYNRDVPNPCLGMSSLDFARLAVGVYAANNVFVWMIPEDAAALMSTPELSFLIRHLNAHGGLNISASHNPPDDNGAKIYNESGGQEVPPNDEKMVKLVESVERVAQIGYEQAKACGLVRFIPGSARQAYIDTIKAVSLQPDCRDAVVVFSPLHGTGKSSAARVLEESGFNVIRVDAQWPDDPLFSEVPGQKANPEEPPAMILGTRIAKEQDADLFMATDPDADRVGAVAPDSSGAWHYLDGNQIGVLLASYILQTRARLGLLPAKPLAIKTEVTTSMIERVVEKYKEDGACLVGDLLVGFKYIGDVLRQIEEDSSFRSESFTIEDFVFACEESHGYLVTPEIRDKDAAGACLLLAELASALKKEGRTLIDYLDALYAEGGVTRNMLISVAIAGAEGKERLDAAQESLRQSPPKQIAGIQVIEWRDLQDSTSVFGPVLSETDRVSRNVLLYKLERGSRVAIRPSGTEPKTKIYLESTALPQGDEPAGAVCARVDDLVYRIAKAFVQELLGRTGLGASDPGLTVSGFESWEAKRNFQQFLNTTHDS